MSLVHSTTQNSDDTNSQNTSQNGPRADGNSPQPSASSPRDARSRVSLKHQNIAPQHQNTEEQHLPNGPDSRNSQFHFPLDKPKNGSQQEIAQQQDSPNDIESPVSSFHFLQMSQIAPQNKMCNNRAHQKMQNCYLRKIFQHQKMAPNLQMIPKCNWRITLLLMV